MSENKRDGGRELLKERSRQIFLRQESLRESYRHVEKLYFWMNIATTNVVFFSLDWWVVAARLCVVFAVLSGCGLVTFIRLVSLDVQNISLTRTAKKIQDILINLYPDNLHPAVAKALDDPVIAGDKMFCDWSSPKGIFERAWILQGTKTIVALLNCCFLTASLVISIWPVNSWFASIVGLFAFLLGAFLHVLYAWWRYLPARIGPVQYKASSLL